MKNSKFEVFRDKQRQLRFRLVAKNGRIIAQSEGYKTKAGVNGGIKSIRNNVDAPIVYLDK